MPSKGKFGESKVPTKMQSQSMQKNVPMQLFDFLDKSAKGSAIEAAVELANPETRPHQALQPDACRQSAPTKPSSPMHLAEGLGGGRFQRLLGFLIRPLLLPDAGTRQRRSCRAIQRPGHPRQSATLRICGYEPACLNHLISRSASRVEGDGCATYPAKRGGSARKAASPVSPLPSPTGRKRTCPPLRHGNHGLSGGLCTANPRDAPGRQTARILPRAGSLRYYTR